MKLRRKKGKSSLLKNKKRNFDGEQLSDLLKEYVIIYIKS